MGDVGQAHDLRRGGGPRLLEPLPSLIEHRLDAARGVAGDDHVAHLQGARLDDGRGHGTA